MKPLDTKKGYQDYVDKKSPNSPILKNCFNAFWVGGLICSIGQIISFICKQRGQPFHRSFRHPRRDKVEADIFLC